MGSFWLVAAPLTVNRLRPLERVKSEGGGGSAKMLFRAAIGLWFGTEEASEVVMGELSQTWMDSSFKAGETRIERQNN